MPTVIKGKGDKPPRVLVVALHVLRPERVCAELREHGGVDGPHHGARLPEAGLAAERAEPVGVLRRAVAPEQHVHGRRARPGRCDVAEGGRQGRHVVVAAAQQRQVDQGRLLRAGFRPPAPLLALPGGAVRPRRDAVAGVDDARLAQDARDLEAPRHHTGNNSSGKRALWVWRILSWNALPG